MVQTERMQKVRSRSFSDEVRSQEKTLPFIEADSILTNLHQRPFIEMPAPMSFQRAMQKRHEKCIGTASASISIAKPHEIISVSEDMARFFGYTPDELTGRSFCIFQGPKTDTVNFEAGISGMERLQRISCILYSRSGKEHRMYLNFLFCSGNQKLCTLQILIPEIRPNHHNREQGATISSPFESKFKDTQSIRSQYNFLVGLSIQRALNSRERSTASTYGAPGGPSGAEDSVGSSSENQSDDDPLSEPSDGESRRQAPPSPR